jgi:hypothetical protein
MAKTLVKIILEDRTIGVVTDLNGLAPDEIAHVCMELDLLKKKLSFEWETKIGEH